MKCFYHVDLDGKCSAFWVYLKEMKLNGNTPDKESFYKINYGMPFPFDEIKKDERIYIVDYSISPEEMDKLREITKNIIWIDHHITAIQKYKGYPHEIAGLRYSGVAGCELSYVYLFHMVSITDKITQVSNFKMDMLNTCPIFCKLIGDRDVWTWKYGNDTKFFCLGMDGCENEPYDEIWMNLFNFNKLTYDIIKDGSIMQRYKESYAKDYVTSKAFETSFEGYNVLAMNVAIAGSDWFDSINKSQYDILMVFSTGTGRYWSYSLYSDTVDVSEIAKKYGGGGHKGAAGFSSKKLLLKKPDNRTLKEKILSYFNKRR